MTRSEFEHQYFEDPNFAPGLKGGDEVRGYGYYPNYFPVIEAQLAALAEVSGATSLLDAGCGKGALVEYARTALLLQATGMDISEYATRQARRRNGGDRTVRASMLRLPFGDEAFDLVWCNGVLQYLDAAEARQSLAELGRVTRCAAFVSNIAATVERENRERRDHLTRLYLRPGVWEGLARQAGCKAIALPYDGESAILVVRSAPPLLALRFVERSFEYMKRLGCLERLPDGMDSFQRRARRL